MLEANVQAVEAFLGADTQWRLAPSGAPIGLDYAGVLAAMTMLGIAPSADLLERVRVLEGEARRLLAGRVADEAKRAAAKARKGGRAGRRTPRRRR